MTRRAVREVRAARRCEREGRLATGAVQKVIWNTGCSYDWPGPHVLTANVKYHGELFAEVPRRDIVVDCWQHLSTAALRPERIADSQVIAIEALIAIGVDEAFQLSG